MTRLKQFLFAIFLYLILDFLWLGFVVKEFNLEQLAEIGRIQNGDFQIHYLSALIAYFLMAFSLVYFVLPKSGKGFLVSFINGALMGLIIFGVYDATNYAILKNYPMAFAMVDVFWGTLVSGLVSAMTNKIK